MALATHTPALWNDILSTTMHNIRKDYTDNIFGSRPLLHFYMSNGRVRKVSGGISIVEPLVYDEGQADSYSEWQPLAVVPQQTVTAAQFPWKQLFSTIAISGLEEAQNNSKEMIINLLEAKIMQSRETQKGLLNGMLFGTRAGTTPANDFTGLPALIDDTAAVGGIDPATEAWWKSYEAPGGALDAAGLEAALRTAYLTTSDAGADAVDAIFTNPFGFGFYESTLTPQMRYSDVEKANLGFQNLMFKNVPLYWDPQCSGGTEGTLSNTSATYYGLNSKYVGLVIHTDRDFKQSPFTDNLSGTFGATSPGFTPPSTGSVGIGVDARVSFITTFGNQTVRNRRRLFKVTGVTEAP